MKEHLIKPPCFNREVPQTWTSFLESGRDRNRVTVFNRVQMDLDGVEQRKQCKNKNQPPKSQHSYPMFCILLK